MKPEWRIDKHQNKWYSWYVLERRHPFIRWSKCGGGYDLVLHFGVVHDNKWLCAHCMKEPPKEWLVAFKLMRMGC